MGMDVSPQQDQAVTGRHRDHRVNPAARIALSLCAGALAFIALALAPAEANAKPPVVRAWAQAHGVIANGHSNFFATQNGPYTGFGGQIGVALLYFEVYYDMNVFDLGRESDENTAMMWNELGGGINVPVRIVDKVQAILRLDAAWVRAPYNGTLGADSTNGFATRGGAGIEYSPVRMLAVGGALYGGYHILGLRQNGDNGSHLIGQIYTRFNIGR